MRLLILSLLCLIMASATAQDIRNDMAVAGAHGVFVFTGEQLMRSAGPITGIRIERRTGADGEFKRVADLKPVTSAKDISKGIEKAATMLPYPIDLHGQRADSIWQRVQRHGTREQLGAANHLMPVLLAVGAVWCDTDVKPGTLYQYRVTPAGTDAQLLSRFIDPAQRASPDRLAPHHARFFQHQRALNTYWLAMGDRRPAVVEVHRSMDEAAFTAIRPEVLVERQRGDTIQYRFSDTTAVKHHVFRYVVKGWDPFGNAMPPCDTLYAASLDPAQMPMPYDLHATGDSSGRAIHVRWKLDNAPVVKQITLQRSTNSVDGFTTAAELGGDRTAFTDEDIRPATSYFYRFVLEYKATHVPMRGVSFAAVAYDPVAPTPPLDLHAEAMANGILLTWDHPDPDVLGFEVYRGEGNGPLMLATPRLPTDLRSWPDTAQALRAGHTYRYAMRAISTSHVESALGDTATVMARHNAQAPDAPRDLHVQVDGDQAIVQWEDQSHAPLWASYQVLVQRPTGRTDTLYRHTNFLIDTLDAAGRASHYRVAGMNALGLVSAPTPAVGAQAYVRVPAAPAGITARRNGTAVELAWEPPAGETLQRFDVYRYVRGRDPVKVGSVPVGKPTQLKDNSPVPGQLNFYFVRSVAANGAESGPGKEAGVQM